MLVLMLTRFIGMSLSKNHPLGLQHLVVLYEETKLALKLCMMLVPSHYPHALSTCGMLCALHGTKQKWVIP